MVAVKDILIIGAGPGGYVAALRAAQLGASVTLVEKEALGGVCLNWGCIPTKTLLRSAEVYTLARDTAKYGVRVNGDVTPDWPVMQKRKADVVKRLSGGVGVLLDKAGVEIVKGTAKFISPTTVEVDGQRIEGRNIIIATGSRSAQPPIPGADGPRVIDSTAALALESLPASLAIIGAGAIGVEFATLFAQLGVKVTVVEMLPAVLPTLDEELGAEIARQLKRLKVETYVGAQVSSIEHGDRTARLIFSQGGTQKTVEGDLVLMAVGRRPNVEVLDLAAAGVKAEKSGIVVDEHLRTNVPHIYAVGDVTGKMLLAHVAMHQGMVAAENALGNERTICYESVPSCVFSSPEVATVGLSEKQAVEQGYKVRVGRFPFRANGKALASGEYDGFVKVVADEQYGQVLGVHIVGPHASDLIHEAALAIAMEATLDEIESTVHAHPTLSEALAEAASGAAGRAIHLPKM